MSDEAGVAQQIGEMLQGFHVAVQIPVAWGEMDAFRHVNNVVFFRYFETARIEYLRRVGFGGERESDGLGPILATATCRFRRPLTFPDTVTCGVRTTEMSGDRFTLEYRLVSHGQMAVAAEGGGIVVGYDYRTLAKAAIPEDVRAAIEEMEGRAF
jgi:acyl-CoA thioester hydrolase